MGLFDSVLGSLLGGNNAGSALAPIVGQLLGNQDGAQSGLGGLVQRFVQSGHGDAVNSWVGNDSNQPIEPGALQHVFGADQIAQWSQQTGLAPHDLLGQLAQFLPTAINAMTPSGQVDRQASPNQGAASESPFDGPGMP